ncbi:MAG: hypothetical protein CMM87_00885 [Rickettsiales bacterium]|nr:hypothetical protein [Rickettsiales bacterium]
MMTFPLLPVILSDCKEREDLMDNTIRDSHVAAKQLLMMTGFLYGKRDCHVGRWPPRKDWFFAHSSPLVQE